MTTYLITKESENNFSISKDSIIINNYFKTVISAVANTIQHETIDDIEDNACMMTLEALLLLSDIDITRVMLNSDDYYAINIIKDDVNYLIRFDNYNNYCITKLEDNFEETRANSLENLTKIVQNL